LQGKSSITSYDAPPQTAVNLGGAWRSGSVDRYPANEFPMLDDFELLTLRAVASGTLN